MKSLWGKEVLSNFGQGLRNDYLDPAFLLDTLKTVRLSWAWGKWEEKNNHMNRGKKIIGRRS